MLQLVDTPDIESNLAANLMRELDIPDNLSKMVDLLVVRAMVATSLEELVSWADPRFLPTMHSAALTLWPRIEEANQMMMGA